MEIVTGLLSVTVGAYEEAPAFDVCLQDDRSGSLLHFSSTTGGYQFTDCRNAITRTGTGTITNDPNGCNVLQDIVPIYKRPDRSVLVQVNRRTHAARAPIKIFPNGASLSITDTDITHNTSLADHVWSDITMEDYGR